ncbi:EID1-like F-box protein 2 [Vitis vinifera]|uniref:EID1-like F-box protein 2 n=1 Tax=Vitis vinifera TaxID=29760 RepID=A0A438D4N8_VITVI|nr:EID1-like F-box protein 2 [Vitis vinifera]
MMLDLQSSGSHSVDGNWRALGKLLIYCSGCTGVACLIAFKSPVTLFTEHGSLGHQGRVFFYLNAEQMSYMCLTLVSILTKGRRGMWGSSGGFQIIFYVKGSKDADQKGAQLHPTEVCPYCKAKLWSMLQAKMIPQSASCRLGAYEDCIEYYVCLNGHMLGICTLLPLSDSEEASE